MLAMRAIGQKTWGHVWSKSNRATVGLGFIVCMHVIGYNVYLFIT